MSAMLIRYLVSVLPRVERALKQWRTRAEAIPDPILRTQAVASLTYKKFHCQGGSVFCAASGGFRSELLSFIVAYQTMCDYLDNLCDRAGVIDECAFRLLHRSLLDAVRPETELDDEDYYAFYPCFEDGGYLRELVRTCRYALAELPYYDSVQPAVERFAELYTDLQVYKHLETCRRVSVLTEWFDGQWQGASTLYWQEFAAACGSTLGLFALCEAAAGRHPPQQASLTEIYFPWICGWHILLDYLIDLAEDRLGGDLNFVSFYETLEVAEARLAWFYRNAASYVARSENPELHLLVLHGLPAMYLSDDKVVAQGLDDPARRLLDEGGCWARTLHLLCRLVRRIEMRCASV
ncbi:MAG: tetraprenyl-beta-curcumene synthase family protein [Firmicutes bacterium]|jgi:tetraprenyl-beta-curcumene synthase|nr:tetraprenyl-beta-curcumene synthase family protein [Bacillota bacterium]